MREGEGRLREDKEHLKGLGRKKVEGKMRELLDVSELETAAPIPFFLPLFLPFFLLFSRAGRVSHRGLQPMIMKSKQVIFSPLPSPHRAPSLFRHG